MSAVIHIPAAKRRRHAPVRITVSADLPVIQIANALAGCGLVLRHRRGGLRLERIERPEA